MKRALIISLTGILSFPVVALTDEIKVLSAFDYLVGYEELAGKTVQIEDCQAVSTSVDSLLCAVNTETGNAGSIIIDLANTPKKQLVYGLKKCGGIIQNKDNNCIATVIGTAGESGLNSATIDAKEVIWQAEK